MLFWLRFNSRTILDFSVLPTDLFILCVLFEDNHRFELFYCHIFRLYFPFESIDFSNIVFHHFLKIINFLLSLNHLIIFKTKLQTNRAHLLTKSQKLMAQDILLLTNNLLRNLQSMLSHSLPNTKLLISLHQKVISSLEDVSCPRQVSNLIKLYVSCSL